MTQTELGPAYLWSRADQQWPHKLAPLVHRPVQLLLRQLVQKSEKKFINVTFIDIFLLEITLLNWNQFNISRILFDLLNQSRYMYALELLHYKCQSVSMLLWLYKPLIKDQSQMQRQHKDCHLNDVETTKVSRKTQSLLWSNKVLIIYISSHPYPISCWWSKCLGDKFSTFSLVHRNWAVSNFKGSVYQVLLWLVKLSPGIPCTLILSKSVTKKTTFIVTEPDKRAN